MTFDFEEYFLKNKTTNVNKKVTKHNKHFVFIEVWNDMSDVRANYHFSV